MTFNAAAEFPKAGLTPDENGEYKMGKIAEEAIKALGVSDLDQFRISPAH